MKKPFIAFSQTQHVRHVVAERFGDWLEKRIVVDGRGDEIFSSAVDPIGKFWLGRLGPKDFVTLLDERGDTGHEWELGAYSEPIRGLYETHSLVTTNGKYNVPKAISIFCPC